MPKLGKRKVQLQKARENIGAKRLNTAKTAPVVTTPSTAVPDQSPVTDEQPTTSGLTPPVVTTPPTAVPDQSQVTDEQPTTSVLTQLVINSASSSLSDSDFAPEEALKKNPV